MKKALLKFAFDQSRRELHNHPQYNHFPHWTYLVVDNQIISVGMNRSHEPPRCFGYHSRTQARPKWHSEADAIKRARCNLTDCIAINVRLNKDGEARLSMPCEICRNVLHVVNCKKVYFTTDFGWGTYDY